MTVRGRPARRPSAAARLVAVIIGRWPAGFLAVWMTAASPADLAYPLIALSGLAMGLQMNAVRLLHVPSVSATSGPAGEPGLPAQQAVK